MRNPILQALNAKTQNNQIQTIAQIRKLFEGKNPNDVINYIRNSNPAFDKFFRENNGKTAEEIAMEYDLDIDLLKKFI